ncbi:MAG: flippase [Chloroflexota bacterium]
MILLFGNGGSAVLSFLLSVLIGRVLGTDGLGSYATTLAWVFPLSLMAEFGLGTLITRDVAQVPDMTDAYVRTTITARLLIGSVLAGLLFVLAPILSQDTTVINGLRISAPLILILPLYSTFTAVFRAHQRMLPVALLNAGMLLSQVILTLIWFLLAGDMQGVFVINLVTSGGQMLVAGLVYRRVFYQATDTRLSLRPLLIASAPFAIAAVLAAFQLRINIILLEQFSTVGAVGIYAAVTRFIDAGRMIPHAFFDALFPLLASMSDTPQKLVSFFRRVLLGLLVFGMVFGITISFLSGMLITFTYGAQFEEAISVLMLAGWVLLPMILKSGRILFWYAQGQETFVNIVTSIALVVQIVLAWWLIPQYGAMGAVFVSIIVELVAFLLLMVKRR